MIATTRVGLLAGGAVLALGGAGLAETSVEAQNEELRARVAQLETRLAAMETQDKDGWLSEQRSSQIKTLVQDVLADADSRSSLMAQGTMTAGYDNGFVLGSADSNWLLRTNLLLQTRFMMRNQDSPPGGAEETLWGFEVTRAKFVLSGHVINPQWLYKVSIETSSNDDATVESSVGTTKSDSREGLLDAWVGYDYGNGIKIMMGSMKAPLLYEELIEDQYQQAVERSVVNYIYTGGYTDGILVQYANDMIRLSGMYNNGINDGLYGGGVPGGPNGAALVADTDFAATIRAEWLASGRWDQFNGYTSPQNEEMGVLLGGAFHYQSAQSGVAGADVDLFVGTLDGSAEFGGGNVYGAFIFSNVDPSVGSDISPWAFILGGGWYFHKNWELFGRYEWSDTDDLTSDDVSIITLGVAGYLHGQNAKWTTDVGFGLDPVNFSVPVTGWAIDGVDEDGQFVLRSQLQILF
jgi:hypothetical protein